MSRDAAGRGGHAHETRVETNVIGAGTPVVLKTDSSPNRQRFVVTAAYIRAGAGGALSVTYTLAHTVAGIDGNPRVREFEVGAAVVELADPSVVDAADDLAVTTPGGRLVWRKEEYGDSIRDAAGRFHLILDSDFLATPIYFASDDKVSVYSPKGLLPEVKAWCEARLSEALPLIADPIPTATVAGVDGVEQTVPLADAPGW